MWKPPPRTIWRRRAWGRAKLGSLSTPKAPVLFDGKKLSTAIYSRDALKPGKTYRGPGIVTEYSATTAIPPGNEFYLHESANLVISVRRLSEKQPFAVCFPTRSTE